MIISNEDYGIVRPIKIAPIWNIFKSKPDFVFMILTCFPHFCGLFLSLKIQLYKKATNKNWREEIQPFGT